MNVKDIKSQLKKIKKAVDMLQDNSNVSALEMDLLKDYIKQLYELTIQAAHGLSGNGSATRIDVVEQKPAAPSESVKSPKTTEKSPPAERPIKTEKETAPSIPANVEQKPSTNKDIESLFVRQEINELSEKLSTLAVDDLKKAMSINEKIFTINELFDGNSQIFNECLDKLESLSSYDQAEAYLVKDIAPEFDWTATDRKKKAIKFIGLVQRRFR